MTVCERYVKVMDGIHEQNVERTVRVLGLAPCNYGSRDSDLFQSPRSITSHSSSVGAAPPFAAETVSSTAEGCLSAATTAPAATTRDVSPSKASKDDWRPARTIGLARSNGSPAVTFAPSVNLSYACESRRAQQGVRGGLAGVGATVGATGDALSARCSYTGDAWRMEAGRPVPPCTQTGHRSCCSRPWRGRPRCLRRPARRP